ncbi:MAG TPA: cobalt-precorrin-6A reductase [Xanthobacteraceae bacterium]|jgi:precorrin-6A/cobalt-precorrin-6A reductase|nr:cobalt-precorrin-6A reductase [Xanthobacteraceae bacterium]
MPSCLPSIPPYILILGGTTEGRLLGERLAKRGGLDVVLSLAGRTAAPVPHAVPVRVGGFGGSEGLTDYLIAERVDALIDATHPYATVISENAIVAAHQAKVPFVALRRPPWIKVAGDRWIEVDTVAAAASAIGEQSRKVFVALGRNELTPFSDAPQHRYLFRSVDPIDPPLPLPHANYVTARGPFSEADDCDLMTAHGIDVVIAKNSGGTAAYGKIAAARALGVDVILLRRPSEPEGPTIASIDEAVAWLDHALTSAATRGV